MGVLSADVPYEQVVATQFSHSLDRTHERRWAAYADPSFRVRHILANLPADASTRMLPAECYTDPDFFAFEQRAVFTAILALRRPCRANFQPWRLPARQSSG